MLENIEKKLDNLEELIEEYSEKIDNLEEQLLQTEKKLANRQEWSFELLAILLVTILVKVW